MAADYAHRAMINVEVSYRMFDELIDPCNIVLLDERGKYSLGHLRYQEYLAARFIISDRTIEIQGMVGSEWWRDTLCMAARMSDNLFGLCQWAAVVGGRTALQTIRAMIATAPAERQKELRNAILPMIEVSATNS